jgi:hypothetical protein
VEPLTLAIIGHLVGDYLFQTDWMAENKKHNTLACVIHCAVWAACVVLLAGWGWIPFMFLFVTHFIQDRTYIVRGWMHLVGQDHFATGPYAPWSMVIVDNTFHLLEILIVWKFLVF